MRKKILVGLLILFMAASATAVASDALKYKGMPVRERVWTGKSVKSKDVPVVVMDGRTMIPVNMLKLVGYTITTSGNKVIVVPASNKNYLNNIGILTSFSRLFVGLRELEGMLLLSTVESGGGEKISQETIAAVKDSMAYWEQEYAPRVKLLDDVSPIDDYPRDIYRGAEEAMKRYRQTVESWTKYAESGSKEDLNVFLPRVKDAQKQLKAVQQSVDDYLNKNFVKLEQ